MSMKEKLNFTIMQNNKLYKGIVESKTYEEFIKEFGNELVYGYKNGKFKEKRFKTDLIELVKGFS